MTDKEKTREAINKLIDHYIDNRKVGSIQINFFKGGVTTINLNNTIKLSNPKD